MFKLSNILFPTDFSPCADQAMEHAVYLSRKYGAELHILNASSIHVEIADYSGYVEKINAELKEAAINNINSAIKAHKADDLKIKQVLCSPKPAGPMIIQYAGTQGIDLIVMGTHGRRGLGHLFLGSIAEEVVRLAPCPVFTVRELKEPMPVEEIERILVPIDFSDHSKKALRYAKEMAAIYGARLQLLHVIEEPIYPAFYTTAHNAVSFTSKPDVRAEAEKEMERFLKETSGTDFAADINVINGRAARDIVKFAESNATDLIVIATHGLTGIKHLLMGSVAEKVVRLAPCPVFTMKTFGKSLIDN
jgi:nucleotide-binding universal stress UspA family protein